MSTTVVEQLKAEEKREEAHLRFCTECGCGGRGICGRMIAKDESVWPNRDTGFRFKKGEDGE